MANDDGGEKTESPTAKRRSEAREEGNIAKSQELNTVVTLMAATIFLRFYMPTLRDLISDLMIQFFSLINAETAEMDPLNLFMQIFPGALKVVLEGAIPLGIFIMFLGVGVNLMQVGFLFTLKPLEPKLSKIDPIKGSKKFFSMRSIVDTLKNIMKLIVVGTVAYTTIKSEFGSCMRMVNETTYHMILFTLLLIFKVTMKIILTLLVIAIIDYAYQKYEHEKKLKMSKQEIKEEHKAQEGDPKVKGRIRQLQREMSQRRMMNDVPQATVVVTNPTHLSIAIQYEENMSSPLVVAKGTDNVAMKIREIAQENDIPLYEDIPLARAMYDIVEPGDEIPVEFYNAVAEVLAFVYKLQGKV
jgi:flagellar biosynthetic protein FlhB